MAETPELSSELTLPNASPNTTALSAMLRPRVGNRSEKRLFQPKTLLNAIAHFPFPSDLEQRQQIVLNWIATLNASTLDEVKEVSLHGEFLRDMFQEVLGYQSVIQGQGKVWEIHAEPTISAGGGSADGALGLFTATETQQERGGEGDGGKGNFGFVHVPFDYPSTNSGHRAQGTDQRWRWLRLRSANANAQPLPEFNRAAA